MKIGISVCLPLTLLALFWVSVASSTSPIQRPILKWQHGGCTSWCMTGWYASPAVADLDGDDDLEIIVASTSFGSDEEWYV
jgi:hypothetical protein